MTTEPSIITLAEPLLAVGLSVNTSDQRIRKDAATLGARYAEVRRRIPFDCVEPRLFVAPSSGYDSAAGSFRYAMGDVVARFDGVPAELERIVIPAGTYAAFVVRPLLGVFWGPAIGMTYRAIYRKWLPRSAWRHDPRGIEHYEHHDQRSSRRRRPEMEIRIPVAPR